MGKDRKEYFRERFQALKKSEGGVFICRKCHREMSEKMLAGGHVLTCRYCVNKAERTRFANLPEVVECRICGRLHSKYEHVLSDPYVCYECRREKRRNRSKNEQGTR